MSADVAEPASDTELVLTRLLDAPRAALFRCWSCRARARRWSVEDRKQHERMGFHEGWGLCAGRLVALAKRCDRATATSRGSTQSRKG